jgi:predicted benzoate:H+ symporter BenE
MNSVWAALNSEVNESKAAFAFAVASAVETLGGVGSGLATVVAGGVDSGFATGVADFEHPQKNDAASSSVPKRTMKILLK